MRLAAAQVAHTTSFTATFSLSVKGSLGQFGTLNAKLGGSIALQTRPSLLADLKLTTVNFGIAGLGGGQPSFSGGLEVILTSKDVYLSGAGPAGKWYKISLSGLGKQLGINPGQLLELTKGQDPLADSQLLAGATNVRIAGRGHIGGVAVTEYAGTCGTGAAIGSLTSAGKPGAISCAFRVWVDGLQRVRKLTLSEHGSGISGVATLQVTSVNRPLRLHLPPPRDILPLPGNLPGNLFGGLPSGS